MFSPSSGVVRYTCMVRDPKGGFVSIRDYERVESKYLDVKAELSALVQSDSPSIRQEEKFNALTEECTQLRNALSDYSAEIDRLEKEFDKTLEKLWELRTLCEKLQKSEDILNWIECNADVDMRGKCPGNREDYNSLRDMVTAAMEQETK